MNTQFATGQGQEVSTISLTDSVLKYMTGVKLSVFFPAADHGLTGREPLALSVNDNDLVDFFLRYQQSGFGAAQVKAQVVTLESTSAFHETAQAHDAGAPEQDAGAGVRDSADLPQDEGNVAGGRWPVDHGESIQITNKDFLAGVFKKNVAPNSGVAVCSKQGDPGVGGWYAERLTPDAVENRLPATANNYFCAGTFKLDERERLEAKKEKSVAIHALMLDDLGTKIPLERVGDFELSYLIETSPGNFQGGIIFAEPITAKEADDLNERVIAAGLCDKGARSPATRWCRLPVAVNSKPKYVQSDGTAFQCRLVKWNPDKCYTPQEIIAGLKLSTGNANAKSRHASRFAADGPSIKQEGDDPIVAALKATGHYKKALRNGAHDVTCPWVDEHTDKIDDGAAYFPPSVGNPYGGFKCHHSHGAELNISKLRAFLDLPAEEEARLDSIVSENKKEALKLEKAATDRAILKYVSAAVTCGETEDRARIHAMVTFSRKRNQDLYPSLRLLFDTLRQVSVADVLAEPNKYHGHKLADPLDTFFGGEQVSGRATCSVEHSNGEITIISELNGGARYTLRHDDVTLRNLISVAAADTDADKQGLIRSFIRAMLMGGAENPVLTPTQIESLLKELSTKSGYGFRAIKSELKQAQGALGGDLPHEGTNDREDDSGLVWPDVNEKGEPRQTLLNVEAAFNHLGINFWFNELAGAPMCDVSAFMHDPRFVEELKGIEDQALRDRLSKGPVRLTDSVVRILHRTIRNVLGPYLGRENITEIAKTHAEFTLKNPFIEEISKYEWDGVPRLDTLLPVYFGALDTPLNREIGAKTLIAAVRRNLEPGCKYDQMAILEGEQGIGKSQGLKILGGDYYISGRVLTLDSAQKRVEGTRDKVLIEEEEMAGHSKADQDQIKSNLSRTCDQVRMAYAAFEEEYPIRCIFIGTTNRRGDYLADETGARRFWPVWCSEVKLPELARDRNQLWAEAYKRACGGESILLPEELWPVAAEEAAKRKTINPWVDVIQGREEQWLGDIRAQKVDESTVELRVTSFAVLTMACELKPDQQPKSSKRIAEAMRSLGWEGPEQMKIEGENKRGYIKKVDGKAITSRWVGGVLKTHTWLEYCDEMAKAVPF